MKQEMGKTLQQGLSDELSSAMHYTAMAGYHGNIAMKREFIGYAIDELLHAQKILELFEQLGEQPEKMEISMGDYSDLFGCLVEYLAKEESATFYYQVLQELQEDEKIKLACLMIQREEEKHLQKMTAILNRIKSGELHE